MAVVEQPLTVKLDVIGAIANAARRFPARAVAIGVVGLAVLLTSMFVVGSMATVPRSFLALSGL